MQDATVGDFQGAISAALAANDKAQAEVWLRQALDRYPRSPAILALAARFEQARGDNQRAAEYWRASLAAMPQASPADRLAHTLVYPDQDMKAHRAMTAADLQQLLDPNYEPFPKTTKVPPLPAYGKDPYTPGAPIDLSQSRPVQQTYQAAPQDQTVQPNESAPQGLTPQDQAPPQPSFWFNSPPAAQTPAGNSPGTAYSPAPETTAPAAQYQAAQPNYDRQATAQIAQSEQAAPAQAPGSKKSRKSKNQLTFEGKMNLPASGPTPPPQSRLEQALAPGQGNGQTAQILPPVVHSDVGDAWKGLIFSLQAASAPRRHSSRSRRFRRTCASSLKAMSISCWLWQACTWPTATFRMPPST
jgi:hypothetical protein